MNGNEVVRSGEPNALDVAHVSYAYGKKKALEDVSFSIPAGRFAVLLGLNGAGKTTLFSLISRLYDTRSGSVRIFGHDIRRAPGEALRRLGIVFQARTLDSDLSVAQNLAYHAALHGFGRREAMARIGVLLDTVGMTERLHDKARNLSGGQMRRVEIVRALLHRPSLLLLDEATAGLDVRARADILATIRALVKNTGIGVLWATHLIDEVAEEDDVVILDQGRVLAAGGLADVVRAAGAMDIAEAFAGLVSEKQARAQTITPTKAGQAHIEKTPTKTGPGRTTGLARPSDPSEVGLVPHAIALPPEGGSESHCISSPSSDVPATRTGLPQ